MRKVTKENLIVQIDRLRKIKDEQGQLSMSSEYTLQAYEMLLATMEAKPVVPDERDKTVDAGDHPLLWSFNEGWNACRATMLNQK